MIYLTDWHVKTITLLIISFIESARGESQIQAVCFNSLIGLVRRPDVASHLGEGVLPFLGGFFQLKDLTNVRCTWLRVDAQYHSPSLPRSVPDVHQLWWARNPKTRLINSICCSVSIETSFDPCCVRQKAAASSQVMKSSVWKSRQPMLAREPSTQEPWQGPFPDAGKELQTVEDIANNGIKMNIMSLLSFPKCELDYLLGVRNPH